MSTLGFIVESKSHHQNQEGSPRNSIALYCLQERAFAWYCVDKDYAIYDVWVQEMCRCSPTFHIWNIVMQLELLLLVFIKSLCEGEFELYKDALKAMAP